MRSKNQSWHFGAELMIVSFGQGIPTILGTVIRYLMSFPITIAKLWRKKPGVVFAENMPIFLVISVAVYAKLRRIPYIIDSHSGAFNHPKWKWSQPIYRVIARSAFVNINTNVHHKELVESWGGRSVIIADIPIRIGNRSVPKFATAPYIAIVASFSFDEPINEIFKASRLVPSVKLYMTGNASRVKSTRLTLKGDNLEFTGFLSYSDYLGLLEAAIGVLVLTTRDHTMQRGAYEALSLGTPIITSDFPILRHTFEDAALYVDNTPEGIAEAIRNLSQDYTQFREAVERRRLIRYRNYFDVRDGVEKLLLEELTGRC